MKVSENWLRTWVNPSLSTKALAEQLTMAGLEVDSIASVDNDNVFEIELTPNRGDCLSVYGLAREISALNCLPIKLPSLVTAAVDIDSKLTVEIHATNDCYHYVGRVIKSIDSKAKIPSWMQARLLASEQKLIHPVVDIVNYVMLEFGQPMHAFDLATIDTKVVVRRAHAHEELTLLDGQTKRLDQDTLVIADDSKILALAGIMGGMNSATFAHTTDIFLESAWFLPKTIAKKARQMALYTDSAYRFERNVDINLQTQAMERATSLIVEICGGQVGHIIEHWSHPAPALANIQLELSMVERILGLKLALTEIIEILERLSFKIKHIDNQAQVIVVIVPSYRTDVSIAEDLIEEIARGYGYNNIPEQAPSTSMLIEHDKDSLSLGKIKQVLNTLGLQEVITYSFVEPKFQALLDTRLPIAITNPISADLSVMRTSLWPGLLQTIQFNYRCQQKNLKIFETGLVFLGSTDDVQQVDKLALAITGLKQQDWAAKANSVDFYDLKHIVDSIWDFTGQQALDYRVYNEACFHPGQCAQIFYADKLLGVIGRLHPQIQQMLDLVEPVYLCELDLEQLYNLQLAFAKMPAKFPQIERDFAIIVDGLLPVGSLIKCIQELDTELVRQVRVFDIYTGKGIETGKKSIALNVVLQNNTHTLVDAEIEEFSNTLVQTLHDKFGAELRE